MAKKEETKLPDVSAEKAQDAAGELMLRGETNIGVTYEQAMAIFEGTDDRNMVALSGADYLTFSKPGLYHFMFIGMDSMEQPDRDGVMRRIETVRLTNKAGEEFINGNTVLVKALKRVTQMPCYVRINYVGDEKAKGGGTYKNLEVSVLPQSVQGQKL